MLSAWHQHTTPNKKDVIHHFPIQYAMSCFAHHDDTFAEKNDRSPYDWTHEQVPAPSRFVRGSSRQTCGIAFPAAPATPRHEARLRDYVAVGDDLWTFKGNTPPKSAQSLFYAAHRQHVALELGLSSACSDREYNAEDWNQLLVGLTLETEWKNK